MARASASRAAALFAAAALAASVASAGTAQQTVHVGPYPVTVATGYGSIWVGTHHNQVLNRIDPKRNRIDQRIILHATPCGELAAGFAQVFVPDCLDEGGGTVAVSVRTGRVRRIFAGGSPVVGFGSLWTLEVSGAYVDRFDPRSGVRLARIPTGVDDGAGGGQESLGTTGAGAVWLGDQAAKVAVRIDAARNRVAAVIPLRGALAQARPEQGYAGAGPMAFAGGDVWYGNPAGVFRIDPHTNAAKRLPVKIGALDAWGDIDVVAGAGSVWVRSSGSTVTRLDAHTGHRLGRYAATGGGGGLTIAFGSLWVANAADDSVWREPLHGAE
jgi:streptogramin lyase